MARARYAIRNMTLRELLDRKQELEAARVVLEQYTLEQVYQELGELGYLIGKETPKWQ